MKNYSSEKGGPDPLNFLSESARAAADGLTHTVRRKRCPGGASKSQAGWQQLSGEKNLKVICTVHFHPWLHENHHQSLETAFQSNRTRFQEVRPAGRGDYWSCNPQKKMRKFFGSSISSVGTLVTLQF